MGKPNPGPGYTGHPSHFVTTEPLGKPVCVEVNNQLLARSNSALLLSENRHEPVVYVPFVDINFSLLTESSHSTFCPFKGDARYWSLRDGTLENIMWAYNHPYNEVSQIAKHGAFFRDKVSIRAGKTLF